MGGQMLGHRGGVRALAFAPDGERIASGSDDLTVRIWSVVSGMEQVLCEGHEGPVTSVAYGPKGRVVVSASTDSTIRFWDVD